MTEHTYKQFDAELEALRTGVLQMGGLVETQVANALEGLKTGNIGLIDRVIEGDHRINLLEVELADDCTQIIAKRQPTAVDLRLIMTVIKSIADLERIGDEAKKIAKAAKRLHSGDAPFVPRVELGYAAGLALDMLRSALDSFARADVSEVNTIKNQDAEVDASFKGIMRQLITFMMEDPRTITSSLEVLFIAKSIERIGDHAKNVSEYVVFLVQGRDVRYTKSAAAASEAAKGN
ncbi:phosphate transport system regulatory protein PhoU [Azoarcus sp. DD4]|uniref:phosphate signaling complex protein PhoU n=1 Tax=Azoarcus sp. DD4 TaxID=2027405 RepID=UPI00112A1FAE|nr:phosphate signaling complex protein PhoU [Azoarcus sp. DD4]QDF99799.1 phosphate transport system regulatory protein PhoU [Azoarcus sp. DD4]